MDAYLLSNQLCCPFSVIVPDGSCDLNYRCLSKANCTYSRPMLHRYLAGNRPTWTLQLVPRIMSLQIIHTTVNCKTKTMAVFLAGGNEGLGKLCCSEQRDNSSHSPVLTSRQCAGRSHVHVDEWKEYTSSGQGIYY